MSEQTITTKVSQPKINTKVDNAETAVATQVAPAGESTITQKPRDTTVVYAGRPGQAGPEGPQGDPGPAGPAAPGASYIHTQAIPSNVWSIHHGLGMFPNVTVIDSAGTEVEGDPDYIDANNVVMTFSAAFGGVAYVS